MANAYIIWDRNSKTVVGNGQPIVFTQSADATAHANGLMAKSAAHEKQPKPVFDVLTVTVP